MNPVSNFLADLLGANWRTSVFGTITVLAAAIALKPETVAFLPDSVRGYVIGIASIISVASGIKFSIVAKDKQVTGGSQLNDPPATPPPTPTNKTLLVAFGALLLTSCATNTGDPAKDRRGRITNAVAQEIFTAVFNSAMNAGVAAISGQNGQDAAKAAFIAGLQVNGTQALDHLLVAYAGPQIQPVADVAVKEITKSAPVTQADKTMVLNTIGAAIQTAANQRFNQ